MIAYPKSSTGHDQRCSGSEMVGDHIELMVGCSAIHNSGRLLCASAVSALALNDVHCDFAVAALTRGDAGKNSRAPPARGYRVCAGARIEIGGDGS